MGNETQNQKPVILIFAGNLQHMPSIPFSVIVLASYLRNKGISVDVLDTRVNNYNSINFNKYCLVGISAKTGEQLSSALEICKHIRANSNAKIVWGGCHATFFPDQVCGSDFADYVVRMEGEETLYELVLHLYGQKDIRAIKGLTYKTTEIGNIKIVSNPERDFIDMNKLTLPAYDKINLNKYQDAVGYLTYEATRGCPHRCKFCYVHKFHNRKWRFKPIGKVIGELKQIKKDFGINRIFICDDNFFVKKDYVIDFCKKIIDCNYNFKFFSQARAGYISGYSEEEISLLKIAGFEFIAIGAESGSQRMLDLIEKDITVEDITESARKCINQGIIPVYSFIIGIPREISKDISKTINCYFELKKISKKVEINGFYLFTPYPGTPIYDESVNSGYKPRQTLEEWASWDFSSTSNMPWLDHYNKLRLDVLSKIILFNFIMNRFNSYGRNFKTNKLGKWHINLIWNIFAPIMYLDGYIRLNLRSFYIAPEWILFGYLARKYFKTV